MSKDIAFRAENLEGIQRAAEYHHYANLSDEATREILENGYDAMAPDGETRWTDILAHAVSEQRRINVDDLSPEVMDAGRQIIEKAPIKFPFLATATNAHNASVAAEQTFSDGGVRITKSEYEALDNKRYQDLLDAGLLAVNAYSIPKITYGVVRNAPRLISNPQHIRQLPGRVIRNTKEEFAEEALIEAAYIPATRLPGAGLGLLEIPAEATAEALAEGAPGVRGFRFPGLDRAGRSLSGLRGRIGQVYTEARHYPGADYDPATASVTQRQVANLIDSGVDPEVAMAMMRPKTGGQPWTGLPGTSGYVSAQTAPLPVRGMAAPQPAPAPAQDLAFNMPRHGGTLQPGATRVNPANLRLSADPVQARRQASSVSEELARDVLARQRGGSSGVTPYLSMEYPGDAPAAMLFRRRGDLVVPVTPSAASSDFGREIVTRQAEGEPGRTPHLEAGSGEGPHAMVHRTREGADVPETPFEESGEFARDVLRRQTRDPLRGRAPYLDVDLPGPAPHSMVSRPSEYGGTYTGEAKPFVTQRGEVIYPEGSGPTSGGGLVTDPGGLLTWDAMPSAESISPSTSGPSTPLEASVGEAGGAALLERVEVDVGSMPRYVLDEEGNIIPVHELQGRERSLGRRSSDPRYRALLEREAEIQRQLQRMGASELRSREQSSGRRADDPRYQALVGEQAAIRQEIARIEANELSGRERSLGRRSADPRFRALEQEREMQRQQLMNVLPAQQLGTGTYTSPQVTTFTQQESGLAVPAPQPGFEASPSGLMVPVDLPMEDQQEETAPATRTQVETQTQVQEQVDPQTAVQRPAFTDTVQHLRTAAQQDVATDYEVREEEREQVWRETIQRAATRQQQELQTQTVLQPVTFGQPETSPMQDIRNRTVPGLGEMTSLLPGLSTRLDPHVQVEPHLETELAAEPSVSADAAVDTLQQPGVATREETSTEGSPRDAGLGPFRAGERAELPRFRRDPMRRPGETEFETETETKPKPKWDVHLPEGRKLAGIVAVTPRPLIAAPSGSAVSPRLADWTARPESRRLFPALPPCCPSTDCQWPPLWPSPRWAHLR